MLGHLTVVTWNINSIRLRLPLIESICEILQPDILCLQEVKCPPENFPRQALSELGFPHQALRSGKGKGGVVILSKYEISDKFALDLGGKVDDCRHISATIKGIEFHNLYVPAGGYIPDTRKNEKFAHKLTFLDDLANWFRDNRKGKQTLSLLCGDLNVAPHEHDVWAHDRMRNVVSHTEHEITRLEAVRETLPWSDVVRETAGLNEKIYSWWSYRQPDWRAGNRGRRLDHIWLCPNLRQRYHDHSLLEEARDWPQPSDHIPIRVRLRLA